MTDEDAVAIAEWLGWDAKSPGFPPRMVDSDSGEVAMMDKLDSLASDKIYWSYDSEREQVKIFKAYKIHLLVDGKTRREALINAILEIINDPKS